MRFSALGLPQDYEGFKVFPYEAPSVISGKKRIYENLADVKEEMIGIMNQNEQEEFSIGQALYQALPFFTNSSDFIDNDSQILITKFNYCQLTNTPPHKSLDSTPALLIDNFTIIDSEINQIKRQLEKARNGN